MNQQSVRFYLIVLISVTVFSLQVFSQGSTTAIQTLPDLGFERITPDNIDDLVLGYALLGGCRYGNMFSPGGTFAATNQSTFYELSTGQRYFHQFRFDADSYLVFSPDGSLYALGGSGVYETISGEQRIDFGIDNWPTFSLDGSLVAVSWDGVYDTSSGQRLFEITEREAAFSPDGSLVATIAGVYEVATGQLRFATGGGSGVFSPDGLTLATTSEIYDVISGQQRFSWGGGSRITFSPDGSLLAVHNVGLYQVSSGELLISWQDTLARNLVAFSPDGSFMVLLENSFYQVRDVNTDEVRFSTITERYTYAPVSFTPDGALMAVIQDGIYDTSTGERLLELDRLAKFSPDGALLAVSAIEGTCLLYGLPTNPWPYRSGAASLLFTPQQGNILSAPSEDAEIVGLSDEAVVLARTDDEEWYRVDAGGGGAGWVHASDIESIVVPDELPIENP